VVGPAGEEQQGQEEGQGWQPLPLIRRLRLEYLPGYQLLEQLGAAEARAYAEWLAHLLPGLVEVADGYGTKGLGELVRAALRGG
jgi:hypothetical protein